MKEIKVQDKIISEGSKPFVVTEAGVNYYEIASKEGMTPLEAAKLMVKEAAANGADAIKFQTYKAEKLASRHSPAYWDTSKETTLSQYELFKKYDKFGPDEFRFLADYAREQGIIFMSTPFDEDAIELVDRLAPVFKIASVDITNFPHLRQIARKQKPIFLSTGGATLKEVKEAVKVIRKEGNEQIVILHCLLNYPTAYPDANLCRIPYFQRAFPDYLIGYSDHTLPDPQMLVLTSAVAMGAKVIEKHFTLNKTLPGNDHYHAMDSQDLKKFSQNLRFFNEIFGKSLEPLASELEAIKHARRSLVAKVNIPKGGELSPDNIIAKRPGYGISPKYLERVLGRKTRRPLKEDELIQWEDLS